MTFEEIQKSAYTLTEREVKAISRQMAADYGAAIKVIDKELNKLYLKTLSGIKPENYFAIASKYDRLEKMLVKLEKEYLIAARAAGRKIEQAAELSLSNLYYRQMYAVNWIPEASSVFVALNPKVLEAAVYGQAVAWDNLVKRYGDRADYMPQAGTLLEELIKKRRPQVLADIRSNIRQGLIQGKGYRETARKVRDVMGTDLNNALRIVRTESNRNMNIGNLAMNRTAKDAGVDVKRQIVSVLDDRTRPQSAQVDGLQENEDGYFEYPGGVLVRTPGNSGIARWDINDRESVINIVGGVQPTVRRARNPVSGETDLISWGNFDDWRRENGLSKNKYDQLYAD